MSTPAGRRVAFLVTKRTMDVVVSLVALVLLSPLLCAIGLAVLGRMGRPVLFHQLRPGLHGQLFRIHKFRTMRLDTTVTPAGDPDMARLTGLGRALRATSLDELPELWNVLCGDMSLVGPRPLLPEYLGRYDSRQARRHELRPGMTGLAQVSGRNAIAWDERLELDVRYVEGATLWGDVRILALTVWAVVSSAGVDQEGRVGATPFPGSAAEESSPRPTPPDDPRP